ncbi:MULTISPECIES: TetR/AcrR family transcriptional regulator [Rhizobium]|uniref:TetR/AcrR family transcriptional regulator n=1 Tax=Rhizobium wuzhouense TaxID=1986026 RepID=A0ABX5NL93_9HYPH|nr:MULTISPECIES: TetR/AcrR family transcriptional regulator [Rhizobium]PYB70485.1 TetR/AcrR family transcriptional regulator [Rhizobium wuzhouense]RKE77622.1 TetR family transcriptional regulator [Rhizobium sp. AG855]
MNEIPRASRLECNSTVPDSRTGRRPRRSAEETRAEILNTAEALFRSHGYANVAIADIASELGMSPANVFKHFRTKTSLVDAIATRAIEQTLQVLKGLDPKKPAPERLLALAEHVMQSHLTEINDSPYLFEMILITVSEELDCGERFQAMMIDTISQIIQSGIDEGIYAVSDVPRLARASFDAMICVIHPVMIAHEKADILATRCREVVGLIDAALRSPLAK